MRQLAKSSENIAGTLERYAGDGVTVVFNDPVPLANPGATGRAHGPGNALRHPGLDRDVGIVWARRSGSGLALRTDPSATLGTIGFEGRFDYAAIGRYPMSLPGYAMRPELDKNLDQPRALINVEDVCEGRAGW